MTNLLKDKYFSIHCKIEPTGERFPLKNVYNEMKIKDLKGYAEFATGIPANLQRLCYLDQGDLQDHTDVRHNEIVPGAVINLKVWNTWHALIQASATCDVDSVFRLGVTANSDFRSPNSEYMAAINPRLKTEWLAERAFVALYVASHRGHQKLCEKLLESGANVNAKTPYGRSPLHVAAARGHGKIVDTLLEKGADIDAKDEKGETPLSVSAKFGNKGCERHLFLFRWQQRAKQTLKNKIHVDMFAHQFYDSANPVWLKGGHGQIYYTQILPPGEFEGTSLSAPRRGGRPVSAPDADTWRPSRQSDSDSDEDINEDKLDRRRREHGTGAMTPIKEESLRERASTGSQLRQRKLMKSKPNAFEEWLKKKKLDEQRKINLKKTEEQRKQLKEEDKRKLAELKDKSYESWLAEKEMSNRKPQKCVTLPPDLPNKAPVERSIDDIIADIKERRQRDVPLDLWQSIDQQNFHSEIKSKSKLLAQHYQVA